MKSELNESNILKQILLIVLLFIGGGSIFFYWLSSFYNTQPVSVDKKLCITKITEESWDVISDNEISFTIPSDFNTDLTLYMNSSLCSFDVYLDDSLLLEYRVDENVSSESTVFLPISQNAAGKTLYFRNFASADKRDLFMQNKAFLGSTIMVVRQFYRDNYFVFMHIAVSLVLLFILIILRVGMGRVMDAQMKGSILSLLTFIVMMGTWIWTDSAFPAIGVLPAKLVLIINYFTVVNMPIVFFWFTASLFDRHDRWIRIVLIAAETFVFVSMTAWLGFGFKLGTYFWISEIFIALLILLIVIFAAREFRIHRTRYSQYVLLGIAAMAFAGLICGISYLLNPGSGYLKIFVFCTYAFYIFLIYPLITGSLNLYRQKVKLDYYRKVAFTDILTEFENRTAFNEQMSYWDEEQEKRPDDMCVIMMDVNNLKKINDTYGHRKGDELIRNAAECIRESFASMGKCYRVGGDEFTVVLEDGDKAKVKTAYEKMVKLQAEYSEGMNVLLEIAYGEAWNDDGDCTMEHLMQTADERMYECKKRMKAARMHS